MRRRSSNVSPFFPFPPPLRYEEEIVEVPQHRSVMVPRYVEVPQIVEKIVEKTVEIIEEEIVEVPKITYEEEVVERSVPGKIQFETKYVEKPIVQKRQKQVPVEKIVEKIVEVRGGQTSD